VGSDILGAAGLASRKSANQTKIAWNKMQTDVGFLPTIGPHMGQVTLNSRSGDPSVFLWFSSVPWLRKITINLHFGPCFELEAFAF
jgi:hypothetical protein